MLFEILGPMRVTDQSGVRPVAGARQRALLGALLTHANQPLPAGKLAEIVWDGTPPPDGRRQRCALTSPGCGRTWDRTRHRAS